MPQCVRRHPGADTRPLCGVLQHLPRTLPRESATPCIQEYPRCATTAADQFGPAADQVGIESHDGRPSDGYQPLLSALALQQHRSRFGINVIDIESHCLGNPCAR